MSRTTPPRTETVDYGTLEVAKLLGMAVRSVQLMADRGELDAWRTPGGHRRIARASVEAWLLRRKGLMELPSMEPELSCSASTPQRRRVLLIEDSAHYQNLISVLVAQQFPEVELHIASNCIVGLVTYGRVQPELLMTDILLPGIEGAALIGSLRSQPQFANSRLIVVTSLAEAQYVPYAVLLEDVPVVHKSRLIQDLPVVLRRQLPPERTV